MTPEERFQKIENSLRHSSELHAQHLERLARNDGEIEKNTAALRDLIRVSRTLIDSQLVTDEKLATLAESQNGLNVLMNALIQAQMTTEHKLQRLIDLK